MTPERDDGGERALAAWRALLATCARRDGNVLRIREAPARRPPAAVWPIGQAIAAGVDLLAAGHDVGDDVRGLIRSLHPYRRDDGGWAPTPRARRRYFDDNAWLGLAFARLHATTGDPSALDRATNALRFVERGEDPEGGIRWAEGRRSRNTCATAPAALLALRIRERTDDPGRLAFARRSLDWLDRVLRRDDGLYADRIDGGRIEPTLWSYNQGAPAAARVELHRATHDPTSLETARETATAAVAWLARGDRLWHQPPVFNAIGLRGLLAVHVAAPVDGLIELVDAYLERAWREARDPGTGLFVRAGIGSYDGRPAIDQAGLAQLFAVRVAGPGAWAAVG
jgi:hypothetical protein